VSELTVTVRTAVTGPVVEVAGELDFHTAPQLREALHRIAPSPGRQLLIDLAGLTVCDSSGITALLVARSRALDSHTGIALVAVPDHLARIFRIVGLDQVFVIHRSTAEAAEAARRRSAD
jgi:anti-sigma B factor antagonist